jgi:hypothetical protein
MKKIITATGMTVYNNTKFEEKEIETFPILGKTQNNWRKRNIILYKHPDKEDYLISVGTTFCESMKVISEEQKQDLTIALEYASRGKIYISQ